MNTTNNIKRIMQNSPLNNEQPINESSSLLKISNASYSLQDENEIAKICRRNQQQKRWILCINSNNKQLKQLAEDIDTSKLLRVGGHHNISLEHIKQTLLKGNCSTVVIYHSNFAHKQLMELQHCAQIGNTQCIISTQGGKTLH